MRSMDETCKCEDRESSGSCEKTAVTAGEAARVSRGRYVGERRRGPDHGPSRHMGQEEALGKELKIESGA